MNTTAFVIAGTIEGLVAWLAIVAALASNRMGEETT